MTISAREDEIVSYNIARSLPIVMTTAVVLSSLLGIASFLLYNYKVGLQYYQDFSNTFYFIQLHPWSILVYHSDDTTTSSEEDTEFADIYIPVPYDPEIPGVRCVDAEEEENVDIAMVATHSDDGGEDIELQDLGQVDELCDVEGLDPSLSIEEEQTAEDNLQTGDVEDVV